MFAHFELRQKDVTQARKIMVRIVRIVHSCLIVKQAKYGSPLFFHFRTVFHFI